MSLLSKLFGGQSSKRDTTYTGPKPYGSLLEAAGGQDYYNTIRNRMHGNDVGYEQGYVDKASNPIINRMRSTFNTESVPELKSYYTSMGMKGSPAQGHLAKAYQDQLLNEEAAYAPIYQAAQEARRGDINTATNQVGAFNKGDYDARSAISEFEYANNQDQVNREDARRKAKGAENTRLLGSAMTLGTNLYPSLTRSSQGMTGMGQPITLGGVGTFSPNYTNDPYYQQIGSRYVKPAQRGSAV